VTATMILSVDQQRQLREEGYLLLPGIVPRPLVDEALRAINASLGTEGIPKEQLTTFRARTFTPELVRSETMLRLFRASPLGELCQAALGPGNLVPPTEVQIALRFPTAGPGGGPAVPHIDGISSPGNGVPPGTLYHFTGLAGLFLSDTSEPDRGNLTVWPGSHRLVAEYLREQGVGAIVDRFPELPLPPPRPILARPGDGILAHYQLAHGIAPNLGPHVRYALFWRLFHRAHEGLGTRPLTDPWLEWEGLSPV
jgi:hypothetical protein